MTTTLNARTLLVLKTVGSTPITIEQTGGSVVKSAAGRIRSRSWPLMAFVSRQVSVQDTTVATLRDVARELVEDSTDGLFTIATTAPNEAEDGHCWRDGGWSDSACDVSVAFRIDEKTSSGSIAWSEPWFHSLQPRTPPPPTESRALTGHWLLVLQTPE
jgi:hypothetical protein